MKGLNQQNGIIRDSKIATPVILTKFIDEWITKWKLLFSTLNSIEKSQEALKNVRKPIRQKAFGEYGNDFYRKRRVINKEVLSKVKKVKSFINFKSTITSGENLKEWE